MNVAALLSLMTWTAAAAFFADVARRCWIVSAWSLLPLATIAALICAWVAIDKCISIYRSARHKRTPADFIRPNTSFPEQPRRGIR
ncbi:MULTISPECIES: hypothetical protein [Xanthomonas]|uniref:Uncharacterized protein n=1 Tax=Xanthomonas dyei TaxID=743699 RepID=A0ABZ0D3H8_9XANT|nr:hypothetical protein [Xanthomonas dyei]WOB24779.1 hypothetical protein NYR99_13315 [Xanthomonas dyei]WOB52407.1 hypothetical protein NYR95_13320 [Xanthomonas dyei]